MYRTSHPAALIRARREFVETTLVEGQSGDRMRVATIERTFVDLLDRPRLTGGWPAVIEVVEAIPPIDLDRVVQYVACLANATTAAKTGWILERYQDRSEGDCRGALPAGTDASRVARTICRAPNVPVGDMSRGGISWCLPRFDTGDSSARVTRSRSMRSQRTDGGFRPPMSNCSTRKRSNAPGVSNSPGVARGFLVPSSRANGAFRCEEDLWDWLPHCVPRCSPVARRERRTRVGARPQQPPLIALLPPTIGMTSTGFSPIFTTVPPGSCLANRMSSGRERRCGQPWRRCFRHIGTSMQRRSRRIIVGPFVVDRAQSTGVAKSSGWKPKRHLCPSHVPTRPQRRRWHDRSRA